MSLLAVFVAATLGQVAPGATPPAVPPSAPGSAPAATPQASSGEALTAGDLLDQLETADRDLRTLTAEVQIDKIFELEGDRQIWRGFLYFEDGGTPKEGAPRVRKFGVRFNHKEVGRRVEMDPYEVVFDGRWLVERKPAEKTIIRTEMIQPGELADPMTLAGGRFPLPIGQKKDEILKRYDVTLAPTLDGVIPNNPADADALKKFVEGTRQLVLTPKPELTKEELTEIRLWYIKSEQAGRWLPKMARTVDRGGNVTNVQLRKFGVNTPFPENARDVLDTATPREGWNVETRPARQPD